MTENNFMQNRALD